MTASTSPRRLGEHHPGTAGATRIAQGAFAVVYAGHFLLHLGRLLIPRDYRGLVSMALFVVLFCLGYFGFRRRLARAARQIAARRRRAALILLAGLIGVLAAETAGYWLSDLLLRVTGLSGAALQNDDGVLRISNMLPPLLFVAVAGVLGPFVEELFFRQLLIELIERYSRARVAVLVSGTLFGAMHMSAFTLSETLNVIGHVVFGIACGVLYVASGRNLWYPVILHVLVDLSAFAPLLLQ